MLKNFKHKSGSNNGAIEDTTKTDVSKSKPHLVLDEPNNVLSAKTDSNNSTKSQAQLDAQLLEAIKNLDVTAVKSALEAGANANFSFLEEGKKCSALRLSILSVKTHKNGQQSRSEDVNCKEILNLLRNKVRGYSIMTKMFYIILLAKARSK